MTPTRVPTKGPEAPRFVPLGDGFARLMRWTLVVPVVAVLLLALTWGSKPGTAVLVVAGLFLAGSVMAAVHHARSASSVVPTATSQASRSSRTVDALDVLDAGGRIDT